MVPPANETGPSTHALAEGRARAYQVLAELCVRGIQPGMLEAAQASPLLAAALATYPDDQPDQVAADHHQAFGWAVSSFEGVFLDPDGTVGGEAAQRVRAAYAAVGFAPDLTAEEHEHLATELRALAFLCGAEADAVEDGLDVVAAKMRDLTRELLDAHLLRWLPAWAGTLRRLGLAFPTALVDQIEELVLMHREDLGAPWPRGFALPPPVLHLDDESTGLAEVAKALVTPASAGLYLSRDDLARLGRAARVPRGFGDRALLLHNLLRSAADLDALPALLDGLDALVEAWAKEIGATGRYRRSPWLEPLLAPWRERSTRTREILTRLRTAAVEGTIDGDVADGADR